jgi:hypothetical protein
VTTDPEDVTTDPEDVTTDPGGEENGESPLSLEEWNALFARLENVQVDMLFMGECVQTSYFDGEIIYTVYPDHENGDLDGLESSPFPGICAAFDSFARKDGAMVAETVRFTLFGAEQVVENVCVKHENGDITEMWVTLDGMEVQLVFSCYGEIDLSEVNVGGEETDVDVFKALFDVPNVHVETFQGENLMQSFNIDGEIAERVLPNGSTVLCAREDAPEFDMRPYADAFERVEDGLWIAPVLTVEDGGEKITVQNFTVKAENGILTFLSYEISYGGGTNCISLVLSRHGEIEIEATDEEIALLKAFSVLNGLAYQKALYENFTAEKTSVAKNYTVLESYRFDGNVYEYTLSYLSNGEIIPSEGPTVKGGPSAGYVYMSEYVIDLLGRGINAMNLSCELATGVYTVTGEFTLYVKDADYAKVSGVQFTLDGQYLASVSYSVELYVYDTETGIARRVSSYDATEVYSAWGENEIDAQIIDEVTYNDLMTALSHTGARAISYAEYSNGVNGSSLIVDYDGKGGCNAYRDDLEYPDLDEDAELLTPIRTLTDYVLTLKREDFVAGENGWFFYVGEWDFEAAYAPDSLEIQVNSNEVILILDNGGYYYSLQLMTY